MVDIDAGSAYVVHVNDRSLDAFAFLGFLSSVNKTKQNFSDRSLLFPILRGARTLDLSEIILFGRNNAFESNCFHYFFSNFQM